MMHYMWQCCVGGEITNYGFDFRKSKGWRSGVALIVVGTSMLWHGLITTQKVVQFISFNKKRRLGKTNHKKVRKKKKQRITTDEIEKIISKEYA